MAEKLQKLSILFIVTEHKETTAKRRKEIKRVKIS